MSTIPIVSTYSHPSHPHTMDCIYGPNNRKCDVCNTTIFSKASHLHCENCDFDICIRCSQGLARSVRSPTATNFVPGWDDSTSSFPQPSFPQPSFPQPSFPIVQPIVRPLRPVQPSSIHGWGGQPDGSSNETSNGQFLNQSTNKGKGLIVAEFAEFSARRQNA